MDYGKIYTIVNIPNAVEVQPFVSVGFDSHLGREIVEAVHDWSDPAIIGWGLYWHVENRGLINIRDYPTQEEAEAAAVLLSQALEVLT